MKWNVKLFRIESIWRGMRFIVFTKAPRVELHKCFSCLVWDLIPRSLESDPTNVIITILILFSIHKYLTCENSIKCQYGVILYWTCYFRCHSNDISSEGVRDPLNPQKGTYLRSSGRTSGPFKGPEVRKYFMLNQFELFLVTLI